MEALIRMEHISKEFPGVKALDDVQFSLNAGEVHALVGENGAGKSTLMKVLTGVYSKDNGSIFMNDKEITIGNVRDAQKYGIVMIHQELNLMNHLSAAENIFIGREFKTKSKVFLDKEKQDEEAKKIFEKLNLDIDPSVKVGSLTVAKQQMVEIAKALSYDSRILIMDEPTAALTDTEIEDLFRVIRMLKKEGRAIIHISHRLEELQMICDRITVMRDGTYVSTVNVKDTTVGQIIKMMVGREIFASKQEAFLNKDAKVALEVKNLNAGRMVKNISFKVHQGEILGFAGLVGAGRTETARAIFGADPHETGEIFVHGKQVSISSPQDAVKYGIAYLSEDRKRYGLALGLDVDCNIALADMNKFTELVGFINFKKSKENSEKQKNSLAIKTPSIRQKVKLLSGGNQQKVVLAKWLTRNSDILIFDEPTRGIDIGAKNEIYKLLNALAEEGKTIIVISSELPEIIRTCHRVLVMCEGRITGEVTKDEINQEMIMEFATKREI
ncbi:sugar ABC transporter ATP-binding protein [Petroclostridium sp. X23]|jgi:ribose transport system ATP-binding protein|uniref:sugar ABC transporter ATP-binding protein n=1 Tax=Petroclostridium sp. X23 TaxID=3045146 RepID=UPI0024AE290D|nr:sugar ABC transporter ATP-binding protein [Petroclostridium sp. X23]WHH56834.1 sugar ABC transporter ATP-binding protein [Petroclostridium sp. X23]